MSLNSCGGTYVPRKSATAYEAVEVLRKVIDRALSNEQLDVAIQAAVSLHNLGFDLPSEPKQTVGDYRA